MPDVPLTEADRKHAIDYAINFRPIEHDAGLWAGVLRRMGRAYIQGRIPQPATINMLMGEIDPFNYSEDRYRNPAGVEAYFAELKALVDERKRETETMATATKLSLTDQVKAILKFWDKEWDKRGGNTEKKGLNVVFTTDAHTWLGRQTSTFELAQKWVTDWFTHYDETTDMREELDAALSDAPVPEPKKVFPGGFWTEFDARCDEHKVPEDDTAVSAELRFRAQLRHNALGGRLDEYAGTVKDAQQAIYDYIANEFPIAKDYEALLISLGMMHRTALELINRTKGTKLTSIVQWAGTLAEAKEFLQAAFDPDNFSMEAARATVTPEPTQTGRSSEGRMMTEAPFSATIEMYTKGGKRVLLTARGETAHEFGQNLEDAIALSERLGWNEVRPAGSQPAPTQPQATVSPQQSGITTSKCVLIEEGLSYNGGKAQLKFKVEGLQNALTYTKDATQQAVLLQGVRKMDGSPFTPADLHQGAMYPGQWLVDWSYSEDGKYRNVRAVRSA